MEPGERLLIDERGERGERLSSLAADLSLDRLAAAWGAASAWQGTTTIGGGEMPAAALVTTDTPA